MGYKEFEKLIYQMIMENPDLCCKKDKIDKEGLGAYGEDLTEDILRTYVPGYFKLIRNVILPIGNTATEIDILMIHEKGVFVFESKNYSGWIFGSEEQNSWTQTLANGDKNAFYNPVKQNKTHCDAIRKLTGIPEHYLMSYIVFSERCTLKKIPKNRMQLTIIKRDELLDEIKKDLAVRESVFSHETVDKFCAKFEEYRDNIALKQEHLSHVQKKNQENASKRKDGLNRPDRFTSKDDIFADFFDGGILNQENLNQLVVDSGLGLVFGGNEKQENRLKQDKIQIEQEEVQNQTVKNEASEMSETEVMNEELEKKIEENYKKVVFHPTIILWGQEKDNLAMVERCMITENTTCLTFYDFNIRHFDDRGNPVLAKTDTLSLKICKNGNQCETLNQTLRPKIDYAINIEYSVDGIKRKIVRPLKYLVVQKDSSDFLKTYYLLDENEKGKAIALDAPTEEDRRVLNVYLWVLTVKNVFDRKGQERTGRINALPPSLQAQKDAFDKVLNGFISNKSDTIFSDSGMGNVSGLFSSHVDSIEPAKFEGDPYKELDSLIGLESIKNDVRKLANLIKVQNERKKQGLPTVPSSQHLVFLGNPGTGKTTIARIIAAIYKDIGVLSKGQMVEVDRGSLVAGYVGQTAQKTKEKIKQAMGGVLFIDEAYTLAKDADKDFGQEAIDTILKAMEDHREDFVVIVAGYPNLMKRFIDSNPGLQSRFNKYIVFEDYNDEEMMQIFKEMCAKYGYRLDEPAQKKVEECVDIIMTHKGENFANARTMRNLFEKVLENQANRLADSDYIKEELQQIKAEDFDGLFVNTN